MIVNFLRGVFSRFSPDGASISARQKTTTHTGEGIGERAAMNKPWQNGPGVKVADSLNRKRASGNVCFVVSARTQFPLRVVMPDYRSLEREE